jgi:RecA-family ATPase
MAEVHETPIARVLGVLKGVKRSDGGWVARCPAHPDRQQSLGIDVNEGKVLLRCHAGCDVASIVSAMGLRMTDLFPPESAQERPRKGPSSLTLAELAAHKKLPVEFLRSLGWREATNRHGSLVEIPYVRRDGGVHRIRLRVALSAKEGSKWGQGSSQIAYEPDGGKLAQAEGYLVVCEGETDTATLLYAGIPALGIPGATATGLLTSEHLEGVRAVFAVRETDQAGERFAAAIRERVQELSEVPVYALPMPGAAKDPSALYQRDPERFAELVHAAMLEAAKPPPEPLDDVWRTLGEWGALTTPPQPRRWLLDRPDDETNGARNVGVFPLGKVGMLISAGGVGKTMLLVELALSVATGRKWLDYFGVANQGRVLIALGEEDAEEIGRRVYQAAQAMRLTDAQIELASSSIVAMPLAGRSVALVDGLGATLQPTAMLEALKKRLEAAQGGWRLIILDPLSRFAGLDTEKDNAAATRFVEVAESLVKTPGNPAVLIAHHTNKTSRADGASTSASSARGASALTDGVRWCANLEPLSDDTVSLEITKSNYAPRGSAVTLVRDTEHGGYLRVQTPAEVGARLDKLSAKAHARAQATRELVLRAVAETPGLTTFGAVHRITKGRRADVLAAYHDLIAEGRIERTGRGLTVGEGSVGDG